MKYLKLFENFDSKHSIVNELADCLVEIFDKYDIRQVKSPMDFSNYGDFGEYVRNIEGNKWFVSNYHVTIFDITKPAPAKKIYSSILDIKEIIENRIGEEIRIALIGEGFDNNRSNAIVIYLSRISKTK